MTADEFNRKREQYKEIDPFWGTQMPCSVCGRCSCATCHPDGPCVETKK